MGRIKLSLIALLALSLLLFVGQNTHVVDVRFLFWKVEMSRAVMLIGVLAVGVVLGWSASSLRRLRD